MMAGHGMIAGCSLIITLLLGAAYLIWIEAVREKGLLNIIGKIIAIVILVFTVSLIFHVGAIGKKMCYGGKGHMMMECKMGHGIMDGKAMDHHSEGK